MWINVWNDFGMGGGGSASPLSWTCIIQSMGDAHTRSGGCITLGTTDKRDDSFTVALTTCTFPRSHPGFFMGDRPSVPRASQKASLKFPVARDTFGNFPAQ
jgi:hypothetical protein